ncbi:hypothetical protein HRI_004145600 [Hibiscus trionum]|uniref:Protein PLASTID REDOX INSENSITIVE 2, chloroplastic n=1 Tax=Hibiscus trionum TaxID=183268 RepID=A0A9W7MJY2_HIBTR|nr:hypothetical protein HRI_004145600 [Hibiscus trionum]
MASSSCSLVCNQPPLTPAKTPTPSPTILILRTAGLILRPPPPFPHASLPLSRSILSLTPISVKQSLAPLRASPHQKYVYPEPIPEFADAETRKFKTELFKKLSKDRDNFGNDLDAVIDVCVEVFSNFLHNEYGGPGTLLVEPFTDMFVALKEKKLPGAPVAARASLLWAQNYVDHDWEVWNSKSPS